MSYIFKEKLDIRELAGVPRQVKKILIAEPEEYLLALYTYHLSSDDFFVKPCRHLDAVYSMLADFAPQLLIINAGFLGEGPRRARCLQLLRQHNPSIFVVTVGQDIDNEELKSLMAGGLNAHIDRRHTKPQDIAAIVNTLL